MGTTAAVLGSPPLWLSVLTVGAIAAACGSSDSHRQVPAGEAGASGNAAGGGEIGEPSSSAGGAAGSPSKRGMIGGAGAGVSSGGGAGGDGGDIAELGGAGTNAGGAGGATSEGCLALHFGTDLDTVQIVDDSIPDFGGAGTIELWILLDSGPGASGGALFNKWVSFQEDKFFYVNADASVSVYFAQQAANFSSTPGAVGSGWQHVALSYDSTSARIYVGGVKVGEQVGAMPPVNSNGNVQIGHITRDSNWPALHGFYSEVRLSNVARYTADFSPSPHLLSDADTTGLWKLDEGGGEIATDSSGLDNPGTIIGPEWRLAPCR